jgi:hypothetical protein
VLHQKVEVIREKTTKINIFRPLRAYRALRELYGAREASSAEVRDVVRELGKLVLITPNKTMGETLLSCLDTMRLSAQMTQLHTQWIEEDSGLQQTAAFAFAILAIYVSIVSLLATLILGILSLAVA